MRFFDRLRGARRGAIIFLHVPKTAGTTLGTIIARQYAHGEVYEIEPEAQKAAIEAFKALPPQQRAAVRLLRGHIGFGLHEYLQGPVTYITMLRDPVDRVVSHYYYVRSEIERGSATPEQHVTFSEVAQMSLADYVQHGSTADIRNGQTKMLAGGMQGWEAERDGDVTREVLEIAKRNLQRDIQVVGLTERFDETVLLFKRALGWSMPYYVRTNVTRRRPPRSEIPAEVVRIIERENALDMELYACARQRFDEEVAAGGLTFQRELARFRFANSRYGDLQRLRDAARYRLKRLGAWQARTASR